MTAAIVEAWRRTYSGRSAAGRQASRPRQRRLTHGIAVAGAAFRVFAEVDESDLNACAHTLVAPNPEEREHDLIACRVPLLSALHKDLIPGYNYNASEDCDFWARFAARDRSVEGSRELGFNRLSEYRLSEPYEPPLRTSGIALYVGAHRAAEDGTFLRQRHGLRLHLFEPSPTFFRSLREAVGNDTAGFRLHNYGLGARNRRAHLRLSETASATFDSPQAAALAAQSSGQDTEEVLIRSASEVATELLESQELAEPSRGSAVDRHVELLHVNCEGCEYDVVEDLHASGHLAEMPHVQLATHLLEHPGANFHEAVELSLQVSVRRYCDMHRLLSRTHTRAFGLPWVWERWTLRPRDGGTLSGR
eukprot:TRINITY_DN15014_c0_g1_i1.p1 TRINITY_DN15014_c0_g1~~TRINITY_DN15014_c0_g1_i1.p1  ORF type:complete len:385 (-),score=36.90 TRINITY_DN15014_c0_g1_i1:36-1124(-)